MHFSSYLYLYKQMGHGMDKLRKKHTYRSILGGNTSLYIIIMHNYVPSIHSGFAQHHRAVQIDIHNSIKKKAHAHTHTHTHTHTHAHMHAHTHACTHTHTHTYTLINYITNQLTC